MSDTPVTSEFSSRLRIAHFTRQLIDRMTTYYEEAPDLQDEAEISFYQKSVHFNSLNSSLFLTLRMLTFNDDLNQPIYYTAGNLMNLMQMMLQNQIAAAETTQHLTTSV
ncbi:uncharacterized protein BDCG_16089 [Blastomyces dermatitidis ER-3]|uniref:Uncharacterized protein n=1 Tax=Ajellomyces dermatitidis (strain ER-3 / ATCC MYA-2586) TaxID=559297 RepID=A0ABX2VQ30_AJEDR|nr:uncharacterized protein BDCG_16089 [Blastomyces dermatitidis ER-3]OAS99368.1 hypothetical protein BDCG_16089 [Blastomyces dermatitidis ER-3]